MSNYRCFVQEFPQRCQSILRWATKPAVNQDREVTLMLMAASAGIVMPYERLKEAGAFGAHQDRSLFPDASSRLDQLLSGDFIDSDLCEGGMNSWGLGTLDSIDGELDQWPQLQENPSLPPYTDCGEIVRTIRNALAHGNVYTRAGAAGQIREIVFICKCGKRFRFLRVKPAHFLMFLHNWFDFMGTLHLPRHVIIGVLEEAG